MTLLFDAMTIRFDGYVMLLLPAAALAVMIYNMLRGGKRSWVFIMGGVTILLFLLVYVLPIADLHHVQSAAQASDVKTVEGLISNHSRVTEERFTGTSRGMGVSTTHNYRTVTTESFYVGQTWFWFEVYGFPSEASFTNSGDPPITLKNGQRVRVSYFDDPWYDQARITKMVMLDGGKVSGAVASVTPSARRAKTADTASLAPSSDKSFEVFWQRFSQAAARGDSGGIKVLTRFPLLFAGTPLDAARFDSIWMGIFPEPIRPCFGTATPMKDGDAWSVSCGAYVYVFNKSAAGWQFTDFTADPEAEQ